jgi:mevalonate kinase
MTTSSAPGKIILFGEHAVVYGRPALAVPVTELQARVEVTPASKLGIHLHAPDIGLKSELSRLNPKNPLVKAVEGVLAYPGMPACPAITIHISSTIPVAAGLGSGAAVSVALIRALAGFLGQTLPYGEVSALAFEVEKLHHGTPSGIDNTVIAHARPVYFITGQPMELLTPGAPFYLVIGDTGIPAPTKESVADVHRLWQAHPDRVDPVFDAIGSLAVSARARLLSGEWRALGELMDANHALLQELSVSCPALDNLVKAAKNSAALGAKMSGGGRGGNMIALVEKENASAVAEALKEAGSIGTIITRVG